MKTYNVKTRRWEERLEPELDILERYQGMLDHIERGSESLRCLSLRLLGDDEIQVFVHNDASSRELNLKMGCWMKVYTSSDDGNFMWDGNLPLSDCRVVIHRYYAKILKIENVAIKPV